MHQMTIFEILEEEEDVAWMPMPKPYKGEEVLSEDGPS